MYRRFRPEDFDDDDGRLELDVVELPDISVFRGKFALPRDVLFSSTGQYDGWGVARFLAGRIPPSMMHQGVTTYIFEPRHVPYEDKYPHSEVWAFTGGVHIDKAAMHLLDPDFHLKFRERMLRVTDVVIRPGEYEWIEE
jgi:hypothetical protein